MAAASARLCVETISDKVRLAFNAAAASARLCVETFCHFNNSKTNQQPPPRGCVLKQHKLSYVKPTKRQPPPRGCVLKH